MIPDKIDIWFIEMVGIALVLVIGVMLYVVRRKP